MTFKIAPTAANRQAAQELSRPAATATVAAIATAIRPLRELSRAEQAPTTQQLLDAVESWIAAQADIDAAVRSVVGVAILGGAPVTTTARRVMRVRPSTLAIWLRSTWAAGRGRPMVRERGGWAIR